jgi:hypothetical protein
VAKQEQVQKRKSTRPADTHVEETNSDVSNAELAESTDKVVSNIDDILEDHLDDALLADLDEVLGTDEEAATMVAEFIQVGGE